MVEANIAPNFDEPKEPDLENETKKTFTSRKLDIVNCMLIDPRISPSQFKVAFCIIQHTNEKTGAIFPSQERIATLANMSIRSVIRAINGLLGAGWLLKKRQNRQSSNRYAFSTKHINAMLDRRESLEETMREQRALSIPDMTNLSPQEALTCQKRHLPTCQNCHLPTCHFCHPNTLREHLNGTPEVSNSSEGNNLSTTREASAKQEIINE